MLPSKQFYPQRPDRSQMTKKKIKEKTDMIESSLSLSHDCTYSHSLLFHIYICILTLNSQSRKRQKKISEVFKKLVPIK